MRRKSTAGCHPEQGKESWTTIEEILHCVQNDIPGVVFRNQAPVVILGEGSETTIGEILHCVQNDKPGVDFSLAKVPEVPSLVRSK